MSKRRLSRWYPLLLTSGAGLFLEMAVIRWIAAQVRLFSYFKNLALLAAFLGLAFGGMILLSLPLLFAGLVFSESLLRTRESARPLASNLSGSVAGGVLENASLLWGIKSLYIIAAMVYVGALVSPSLQRE
jgi:hypothetical protein